MNKFLTFAAGCGTGILAGLALGSSSGQQLRNDLSSKVQGGVNKLTEKIDEGRRLVQEQGGVRGVVEKGIERGKNVTNIGMHRVAEKVQEGKDRLSETYEAGKNRLNEAVNAGMNEYQRQKDRDISSI